MSITVRFFASLRERIGRDRDSLDSKGIRGVDDVWNRVAQIRLPGNNAGGIDHGIIAPGPRDDSAG
ncbi:MAG: hypothetical protein OEM48_02030 [Gammaproteobacteria bacterium]|nr:hypothetical protein [Gammaproteobacteria bacterium]MDH3369987.1 hypothetical protein [Gammaproteobacteria bacterium]MDH3405695.1 hypothetical protein [Gammaproteobacteria bacterium]MDH5486866.1 hypothetical protein [Gammaproteobacteria bacterium]